MKKSEINILYAEDESLTRMFLSKCMGRYGSVVQAVDGQDALEKFETEQFDILVTDISMPRMDGFTLIKQIKEKSPDIPCIVTTAYREGYESLRDLATFMEKPINTQELYKTIEMYITQVSHI